MTIEKQTLKIADRLFEQKRARRHALAALPFPEKISVLVRLQQMASAVRAETRAENKKHAWKLAARHELF